MAITPQELKKIMDAQDHAPRRGVVPVFRGMNPERLTTGQYRAIWNGRRIPKGQA